VRAGTCRGQLSQAFERRLVVNPVEPQQGKVPVPELTPDRAEEGPARVKRYESERL